MVGGRRSGRIYDYRCQAPGREIVATETWPPIAGRLVGKWGLRRGGRPLAGSEGRSKQEERVDASLVELAKGGANHPAPDKVFDQLARLGIGGMRSRSGELVE